MMKAGGQMVEKQAQAAQQQNNSEPKQQQTMTASVTGGEMPTNPSSSKPKKAATKAEKVLPEKPTEKHPVQLLNEMNGPLVYEQTGQSGVPPSCIFTLTVTVNDVPYQ